MLETKIKVIEDRPDHILIKESLRPWQWGGLSFGPAQISAVLVYLVNLVVKGTRKIVFEGAYQAVTINSRTLFSRKQKQVQFAEIENVSLSLQKMTRAGDNANPSLATLSLELGELSLILLNKSNVKIVTTYLSDKEIRVIGKKISELIRKPFIENDKVN